jgi:hypothetical protein
MYAGRQTSTFFEIATSVVLRIFTVYIAIMSSRPMNDEEVLSEMNKMVCCYYFC